MLTLKQIALAINNKLAEVLPNIPIQSKDISEGFERPSLFVDFDNITTSDYIGNKRERNIQVIIYFFPTDRYNNKIEILEVQEALEQAFSGQLMIKEGFIVYPLEVNSVKVDGVLQFSFEIYTLEYEQDPAETNADYMTDLYINLDERD
ncbi:hypothetical protein QYF48_12180 [Brevibacillus agri]|uniref:phage tail terminator family protein n=1 Tax=Brevibacillus agri TaxID=51101 RepID=UPI0025B65791|nr:hypothetical protein [Brevibacillus agri]MDN4093573.1 hypothetical protein [Brevibacillus agri]